MRRLLVVLAMAVSFTGAVPPSRADEVDDFIRDALATHHIPGLAVAVVKDGKPLFERQYGLANLETDTPLTKDAIFPYFSVSKQFATAATMLLVEQGKVGLDDRASKYLDNLTSAWQGVTVPHLLTATSGIPNYSQDYFFRGARTKRPSFAEVIQTTGAKPLEFQPGEKWAYCNTGFWILSQIVAGQAEKPYQVFLREQIFTPLGMSRTQRGSTHAVVPHRVSGYDRESAQWVNASFDPPGEGDGELTGPLSDLVKWDVAVTAGKVVRPETLQQIQTVATLNDNKPIEVKAPLPLPAECRLRHGLFHRQAPRAPDRVDAGRGPGFLDLTDAFSGRPSDRDRTVQPRQLRPGRRIGARCRRASDSRAERRTGDLGESGISRIAVDSAGRRVYLHCIYVR